MKKREIYHDRKLNEIVRHDVMHQMLLSEHREPLILIHASETALKDAFRDWDRDNYPFTTFEYIVSGAGVVEIDGEIYEVTPGDVYILPPRRHHILRTDRQTPWIKRFAVIHGPLVEQLLSLYGLGDRFHFKNCEKSDIPELLTRLRGIFDARKEDMHVSAVPAVCEIVARLAHLHRPAPPPLSQRIMEIKLYIDRHLYEPLSVETLAERFNLSIRHLIRTFQHDVGTTPYAYYIDKKLELARELLKGSRATAAEIAFRLGFTDAYHFSKMFRAKTGISPSVFRKG